MKKIFYIILIFVFMGSFLFVENKKAEAADPTMTIKLDSENRSSETKKTSWTFTIKTTDIKNGKTATAYLLEDKDGTPTVINSSKETLTLDNGSARYFTEKILDPGIKYTVIVNMVDPDMILSFHRTIPAVDKNEDISSIASVTTTVITTEATKAGGSSSEAQKEVQTIETKKDTSSSSSVSYKLLAPIGGFTEAPENIGDYLNKIFLIAIGFCGALAVLMLIVTGIQYMGEESVFGKVNAKGKIGDALIGLFIALSAYALLNTIDPRILTGGITVKAVTLAIDPEVHGDNPHSAVNGKYCAGKYTDKQAWLSDEKERALVKSAGITINKDNCTYVGQQNCTSLTGLNTTKVIAFKKNSCPTCEVVITGGTECWLHSNKTQHLPGNSVVDLRTTTTLISYIEKNNTKIAATGMNFPVFVKNATKFMKESNHYHIISW